MGPNLLPKCSIFFSDNNLITSTYELKFSDSAENFVGGKGENTG